jgi:hypothetical protein
VLFSLLPRLREVQSAYGRGMTRFVITPGIAFVVAMVAGACGPGQAEQLDEVEDFTEEVQRICVDLCKVHQACWQPTPFESQEACEHLCLDAAFILDDSACGEANRALNECIGSQPTCDLFFVAKNLYADKDPCQAEKDRWLEIDEACQDSGDP